MPLTPPTPELPVATSLSRRAQLRLLALAGLALALIALLIVLVHDLERPPAPKTVPLPPGTFRPTSEQFKQLHITVVDTGPDPSNVVATGTIAVDEDRSAPVVLPYSGQIGDVFVQTGQHVAKGQPILQIASPDFVDARNALLAASAQRATAVAQLKIAKENETRQSAIYQTAGGSFKEFRQAEADLVIAQSAAGTANAALETARDKLIMLGRSPSQVGRLLNSRRVADRYSSITFRAPVSGVVVTRDVAPGQYIPAGGDKPVVVIADLTHVWLAAQIDQTDAAKIHLGDSVDVLTPAYPGRIFHAVIDNVGATLDPTTHRLPVRATVANPDEALKPAMFASFAIRRRTGGSAVLIPSAAVIHEGDSARVWVESSGGLLRARTIKIAESANGITKVSSGLQPGEKIVTSGAIFVNEAGLGE